MGLKILHSADWHLDSPFAGFDDSQRALLKQEQLSIPGKTAQLCRREKCDLLLLAGDIFDNEYDAIRNPEKLEKTLRGIKSTYGVYACWGNHDLNEEILAGFTFKHKDGDLSDIKDPRMKKFLEDSNIHILEDESVLINDQFYVIGRKAVSYTHLTLPTT